MPKRQAVAAVRGLQAGTCRSEWGIEGRRQVDWAHAGPTGVGSLEAMWSAGSWQQLEGDLMLLSVCWNKLLLILLVSPCL